MIITSDRLITHDPTALLMTAGSTIHRQLLAGAGVQKTTGPCCHGSTHNTLHNILQHTTHCTALMTAGSTIHMQCNSGCWLVHGCKKKQGLAAFLLAFMAAQTFHESTNNTLHNRALLVF
jgi:hypothetical protein